MRKKTVEYLVLVACVLVLFPGVVFGEYPEVVKVFGFGGNDVLPAVAFWVPCQAGDLIGGVQWFNNDGMVEFPEFLAIAGELGQPEILSEATVVAGSFYGGTQEWSELVFDQPLATNADGVFLIFKLPLDVEYTNAGEDGGPGFGVVAGGGVNRCWITNDDDEWSSVSISHQVAIQPIFSTDKSHGVIWLAAPGGTTEQPDRDGDIVTSHPTKLSLAVYPNPFNPSTNIKFSLPKAGVVNVSVFDLRGRLIMNLYSGRLEEGTQNIGWHGKNSTGQQVPSGVYFVKVKWEDGAESLRITLAK